MKCEQKIAVSQISIEAIFLSLNAGLRMEELLGLYVSESVVDVFALSDAKGNRCQVHSHTDQSIESCVTLFHSVSLVHPIDQMPQQFALSSHRVQWFVIEDSEAALVMIITWIA